MTWHNAELDAQLAQQEILTAPDRDKLLNVLDVRPDENVTLLTLDGIQTYAASWGDRAGVWLVLAVVRMLREILHDFDDGRFGMVPPTLFVAVSDEAHQQEIGHLALTGYQEIYDVLLRTHRKPSSPFFHRRAITQQFPRLLLEIAHDDSAPHTDDDRFED
jgi:hypothetical protein